MAVLFVCYCYSAYEGGNSFVLAFKVKADAVSDYETQTNTRVSFNSVVEMVGNK